MFTTDKQTLDDLNIFGKHGHDSLYNIFNHCATRGGGAVLEEMFQYPLSDKEEINRRSQIIQQFANAGIFFPFEISQFDLIETYLRNTDERSRLSAQSFSAGKKISALIAPDIETLQIHKGIAALTALIRKLSEFIRLPEIAGATAFSRDLKAISIILAEPLMAPVLEHEGKLSQQSLAGFDSIFRFRHRDIISKLLDYVYSLDVYISVAGVARERNFIFPIALSAGQHTLNVEGLYHPQVKNAVANNIEITPSGNVIFLTGANMAGKSTFMKSISIALFLAHMGFPVPAQRMEFSVLDGMFTSINLPDNLGMGVSHFYAEVLRVKKISSELSNSKNLFIVFDELFRGTNVKDAYEATIAITEAFASKRNSIFIISTHIIEAAEVLKECDNIRFIYLPTLMQENTPLYTYKLEEGVTDDRHGMVIINNERILDILKEGMLYEHQTTSV